MKEELVYVPREYKDIFEIFVSRLKMKHLLKGTTHRDKTIGKLFVLLHDEVSELGREVNNKHETRTIEEALDVMISALLVADRVIQGGAFENERRTL